MDGNHGEKHPTSSEYVDNGIPFLMASDIHNGNVDFINCKFISEERSKRLDKGFAQNGDVLITHKATIGETAILNGLQTEYAVLTPQVTYYRILDDTKLSREFLYAFFNSDSFQKEIKNKAAQSTRAYIGISAQRELSCAFPKSLDEQKRIGAIICCLDNLITLHQCKHYLHQTRLRRYKSISFYQPNTAAWEQRKLLGCIEKITDFRGRTPKKLGMDWSESGYLALSALNVKDGYIDFNQDVHYGDQKLYDKWMSGNELHKGQVLFTTEAPMGNVAQVPDDRCYILSQRTIAFDVDKSVITESFLATVLRTPGVQSALSSLSSGGTAKGVSQKTLNEVYITIPNNTEEQESIATLFIEVGNLITLHQRNNSQ